MVYKKDETVSVDGKGEYKVISCLPDQYTKYEIEDIDKGEGWSETEQKYVGVRINFGGFNKDGKAVGSGWYRGENHCVGETFIVHRNRLEKIE